MDRGTWQATVNGVAALDRSEQLRTYVVDDIGIHRSLFPHPYLGTSILTLLTHVGLSPVVCFGQKV